MEPKAKLGVSWLRISYILFAAVVMIILVSQLSNLSSSINQLKNSSHVDDLIVALMVVSTFFLAALTYYSISLKPLNYIRTVIVESGINTLNRLLPAGLGGIGGNFVYLTKNHHTKAQSGAVVAANTTLGIIANLFLLAVLLGYFPIARFRYKAVSPKIILIAVVVIAAVLLATVLVRPWRKLAVHYVRLVVRNLAGYRLLKLKLFYGFVCQIGLTLAFVLALDFSLKAVHGYLPIGSLMLAYSFAIWLGAIIPAPGGVGSVEAGLVSGLLAFKVSLAQAIAAVLVFRLISFWLPLILGVVPLLWSYRRNYL
ncbi:MAG: lysylphosphatidylglycerol synthase transmembrane domain-containing protein [Candidatus Saccharimonadales bacterium]